MTTIPVPLGVSVKFPLEFVVDTSLPSTVTLSTNSSFNFLLASTTRAESAVTVPFV